MMMLSTTANCAGASSSANAIWGNQSSVLVGDFLFSRAFELTGGRRLVEGASVFSRAPHRLSPRAKCISCSRLTIQRPAKPSILEVIQSKTAELFAAAATRIGAVVAERPDVEEEALRVYGLNLGIAFQLIDDVLDYSAQASMSLGKTIGDDFREGKITLPVILAFQPRRATIERTFLETMRWRTLDQTVMKTCSRAMDLMKIHGSVAGQRCNRAQTLRRRGYGTLWASSPTRPKSRPPCWT